MTVSVVEMAVTWGNFQAMLEKAKKTCPEKNSDIFSKKSHPKQISYTFLNFFFILYRPTWGRYNKKCSASLYFLHCRKSFSIFILYKKILISFTTILRLALFFSSFFVFFRKISTSLTSILAPFVLLFFRKILVPFTCLF